MGEQAIERDRSRDRRNARYHARAPKGVRGLVNGVKAGKLPMSVLPGALQDAYVQGRVEEYLEEHGR